MKSKMLIFAASVLLANTAWAATPENGWWYNPQKSGTGYNIESQNGTMFVATFVYDNAGNPIWYSGLGQVSRNNTVTINLMRSSGGQCLGCVYTAAQTHDSGYQITLSFSDDSHGIVRLDGVETPIERFNFNYGVGVEKLLGVWIMTIIAPVVDGMGLSDVIAYTRIKNGVALGRGAFDRTHVSAVAASEGAENIYASITQISDVEGMVAVFNLSGLNTVSGLATITTLADIKNNPQEVAQKIKNSGVPFVGFRGASTADIQATSATKIQSASYGLSDSSGADIAQIQYEVSEIAAKVDKEIIAAVMLAGG